MAFKARNSLPIISLLLLQLYYYFLFRFCQIVELFIASAKIPNRKGNISPYSFYGQLLDYQSHIFSLIYPVDEFSFKEMRTWGQISSGCLYVWCKSRELGGRESSKFPTPMVESFSTDLLPALECHWTESHLKSCQTSTMELLCESTSHTFR